MSGIMVITGASRGSQDHSHALDATKQSAAQRPPRS